MQDLVLQQPVVIAGLGKSGMACARFLSKRGIPFDFADTRANPPHLNEARQLPGLGRCYLGSLNRLESMNTGTLIVSPGLDPQLPVIQSARERGVRVMGEMALLGRVRSSGMVGITGSNGKSTVTELTAYLMRASGCEAVAAGNIGRPALDALEEHPNVDWMVLELSSFQLETTEALNLSAAVLLNLTDDHLDRHGNMMRYAQAKLRIFNNAEKAIIRDDVELPAPMEKAVPSIFFGERQTSAFRLEQRDGKTWLVARERPLLPTSSLALMGRHNALNVLAALAVLDAVGIPLDEKICHALQAFKGLPHRCELIRKLGKVLFVNDSKATNVGAALAAMDGLVEHQGKIVLIAGGDSKHADLRPLGDAIRANCAGLVLLGRDGEKIAEVVGPEIPTLRASDMQGAVLAARALARDEGVVLLSPACSSLDMFESYEARGDAFREAVEALTS